MIQYHQKALDLLKIDNHNYIENKALKQFADINNIIIPASFKEWADFDQSGIFEKYSNCDEFWFSAPDVIEIGDGRKGLLFQTENQGNFDKVVLLDGSDDPPVLCSWLGEEPWITYTKSFSECIYAQIFDWQYVLDLDNEGNADMAYYGEIRLKSDCFLDYLKNNFYETVSASFLVDGYQYKEFRFIGKKNERLLAILDNEEKVSIRIMGEHNVVCDLESELLTLFSRELIPPDFNSYGMLAHFLGNNVDRNFLTKIKYSCFNIPTEKALKQLIEVHKTKPLKESFPQGGFSDDQDEIILRSEEGELRIKLIQTDQYRWSIESIQQNNLQA